jgi:L,D-peptidoglycan transpeptidase YkuD (ErfK/YbiS/YcfS/YnhG family)
MMGGMPNTGVGSSSGPVVSRARIPVVGALFSVLLTATVMLPSVLPSAAASPATVKPPVTTTVQTMARPEAHLAPGTGATDARVAAAAPVFASRVPARTRQVVRTVHTHRWCAARWCTITQAWRKTNGRWEKLRSFRSTIGPNGFGKTHEGDMRSPSGVYHIKVTFSTGRRAPGAMPWRRRLPTSLVTDAHNRFYNTWIEQPGRTDGDRPSMRYGFIVNYNHVRLHPGVGPKPVIGKGCCIFYHTAMPGRRWVPTEGCTQVGNWRKMRWIVRWLRPDAHPLVVQDL